MPVRRLWGSMARARIVQIWSESCCLNTTLAGPSLYSQRGAICVKAREKMLAIAAPKLTSISTQLYRVFVGQQVWTGVLQLFKCLGSTSPNIKERFFWSFCMGGSWLLSPWGKKRPRLSTSTAASCTFSQPWKRPRWLNAPTALGKAWCKSWKSISLKRCLPPNKKAMTLLSTG